MKDINKLFSNSKFSVKVYINNIRFFAVMMIGLIIAVILIDVLFTKNPDDDMKAAIIFVVSFFMFGVIILSIILIRSVIFKKASFILDDKGIYYNNLLVKSYIYVLWKEIKDLDIIGSYLFIYLKDPQSYYFRKFKGRVISENPLYIHLGDLDISNKFINSMFDFFYDNYDNYDDFDDNKNTSKEEDYKKYYRDYY
ncbi:hypothetical protein A966_03930 [Brachyspira hampsonii 30446]|uniref:Uncharacterized protein n=1 Tax=Brachyspira hampsonii 30446 TaxID=1289135 RepID=A0A2U4F0K1_9SPIR|nr:hypothetical protein [Brachyspira hampsonii]EKV57712.1 hypothetical protein A966_03930 [Brachyspira hampsonii 30446]MBW5394726.1 hypothetical protein [Brachyspira hampsonii]OEJ16992.1 hypothetical protein A9495_08330 [Brachyspira hampsonii]